MNILDVKLTYKCNNHCPLCCQEDKIKNDSSTIAQDEIFEYIDCMPPNEIKNTKIVLTGGEPTLHRDILEIIRKLKNKGFAAIQLQSNITLKSLSIGVNDLVQAGVTGMGISLHGCTAEMHESFTNTKGSFECTVDNLTKLSKIGMPVALNCVISKHNISSLSDIVKFVADLHLANDIQFAFIHITGRANYHHEVVPTISSAAKEVQNAVEIGRQFGIRIKSEAIPFCLMRGFEKHVAELEKLGKITILDKMGIMNFSEHRGKSLKAKCKECEQCLFFSMCEGPWAEYPQFFGWNEFIPVQSVK